MALTLPMPCCFIAHVIPELPPCLPWQQSMTPHVATCPCVGNGSGSMTPAAMKSNRTCSANLQSNHSHNHSRLFCLDRKKTKNHGSLSGQVRPQHEKVRVEVEILPFLKQYIEPRTKAITPTRPMWVRIQYLHDP